MAESNRLTGLDKDMADTIATKSIEHTGPRKTKVILALDNSLIPIDRLYPTPSMKDGLSYEDEIDLRILGCELIQSGGILLRLPQVAMATGQVLFQRFYYSDSFVKHNMEVTSMACIALASKIEEAPRRFRDVINVFHHLKQLRTGQEVKAMPLDHAYASLKNCVISAERRILKRLGFCVHVKHPHKFVVTLLRILGYVNDQNDDTPGNDQSPLNKRFLQSSWNYMNDCLRSDLFVRYTAETIACSCIYLSARVLKIPLPRNWFELFDISESSIEDVCKRILSIYARPKPDQVRLEQVVADVKASRESERNLKRDRERDQEISERVKDITDRSKDPSSDRLKDSGDRSKDSSDRVKDTNDRIKEIGDRFRDERIKDTSDRGKDSRDRVKDTNDRVKDSRDRSKDNRERSSSHRSSNR